MRTPHDTAAPSRRRSPCSRRHCWRGLPSPASDRSGRPLGRLGRVVAAVVAAERLNAGEPAGVRMLAIIGAVIYAMKAVVTVEAAEQGSPPLSACRWLGFAASGRGCGRGLSPGPGPRRCRGPGLRRRARAGASASPWSPWPGSPGRGAGSRRLATALLLPGLSLIVHFGVFDVLAGAWRRAGVDCTPLFRSPLRSASLGEFWGRRWNLAFSEMMALAVYQPLVRRSGRPALAASFLGSGLLHELAISVAGPGGLWPAPGYFALHGGLVMIERRLARAGAPVDRDPGWAGPGRWVGSWCRCRSSSTGRSWPGSSGR